MRPEDVDSVMDLKLFPDQKDSADTFMAVNFKWYKRCFYGFRSQFNYITGWWNWNWVMAIYNCIDLQTFSQLFWFFLLLITFTSFTEWWRPSLMSTLIAYCHVWSEQVSLSQCYSFLVNWLPVWHSCDLSLCSGYGFSVYKCSEWCSAVRNTLPVRSER